MLLFNLENLVQATVKALVALELRGHECANELFRQFVADDARAEGEDIHIVVLDALMRRVSIMADAGANATHFTCSYGGANSAPADHDTALGFALLDGEANRLSKIGIIIGRVIAIRAAVHDDMS